MRPITRPKVLIAASACPAQETARKIGPSNGFHYSP
jgi:hypothetical protein